MLEEMAENQPFLPPPPQQRVNFLHQEINEDELMADPEQGDANPEQGEAENAGGIEINNDNVVINNIQVGLVRIVPTFIPSQPAPVINKAISEPTFNFLHPIPIISKTVNNNGNGKSA